MDTQTQFERWARNHIGDAPPNFAGRQLHFLWMYDDALIEQFWMCWKAAQAAMPSKQ